ncbi:MAG: hypothetical protein IJT51_10465 [Bacteroidales bacterium]|nr:hypothetical protein [Bacteroidales bacterium]
MLKGHKKTHPAIGAHHLYAPVNRLHLPEHNAAAFGAMYDFFHYAILLQSSL